MITETIEELRRELVLRQMWNESVGPTARFCDPAAYRWIRDTVAHNKEVIQNWDLLITQLEKGTNLVSNS